MRTSTGRYNRRYFIFVPLVTVALLYHLAYSSTTIATYLYGRNIPKLPVLTGPSGDLTPNSDYAISAGIHKGDQLLAVNGRPATTVDSVSEAMRGYQVGDAISLTIRSVADGKQRTISFPLEPERPIASTAGEWVFRILVVLIALLSVGLSSYVLLRLPGDPVAIWLFGSLAGLTQLVHTVTLWEWPRWALVIGGAYSILLQGSFQVWMMLFGIYFPERSKWDIKRPWLKYLLIVPLLVANVVYTVIHLAAHYRFVPAGGLLSLLESVDIPLLILASVAQALFFVSIFPKIRTAKSRDAQRRLRLVGFGSVVSLTPPFLMFLYVVLFHRGHFEEVPGWVEIPVVLFMLLLPVTLSYAVLVERATDLRVVIRQGIRYAMARTSMRVLIGILMAAVMWGIAAAIWSTSLDSKLRIVLFVACAVAVVVTTGNLRRRSVDWVDRKFFREAYRSEQILSELNESIRTIIDERSLLETVVLQIEESLHVPSVAILLNHGGELKIGFSIGCEQPETISLDEQSFVIKRIRGSSDPGSIYLDVPDNWVLNGPQSEIAMLRRMETQRLLPIAIRERLLGVLSLGMKRSEEPYSKHDIQLLKSVAFQTALALENSRLANVIALEMAEREKLNREIEIAREVQERLFPQDLPALPGIDYHGACRPAQGVGGDYYDFIPLANGNIGIAVGDVSGKGIAAALLMASLQASLRGQALQSSDDLARIMRNVNRLVFNATPSNRYATFFYAQYDRATRRLTYVNAGHNPPMILRRIGSLTHVIRLDTGGPVIGLFQDAPYQQASLTLEPGDVFIGFTDGISEAMNDADEEWGEERLVPALEACASQRASQMIPSIMAAADLFVNGAPQHDDMTMVVMKLEAAAA